MYFYLADPAASKQGLEKIEPRLKSRLEKFNINNNFHKILSHKDIPKLVQQAVEREHKTLVVVGNDETVDQALAALNEKGKANPAVGIIPVGKNNSLARQLGIRSWRQACNVLATRRLTNFRFIVADDHALLHKISLFGTSQKSASKFSWRNWWQSEPNKDFSCKIHIDNRYKIDASAVSITVQNQKMQDSTLPNQLLLRLFHQSRQKWLRLLPVRTSPSPLSQFLVDSVKIKTDQPITASLGGTTQTSDSFQIKLSQEAVSFITGKTTP